MRWSCDIWYISRAAENLLILHFAKITFLTSHCYYLLIELRYAMDRQQHSLHFSFTKWHTKWIHHTLASSSIPNGMEKYELSERWAQWLKQQFYLMESKWHDFQLLVHCSSSTPRSSAKPIRIYLLVASNRHRNQKHWQTNIVACQSIQTRLLVWMANKCTTQVSQIIIKWNRIRNLKNRRKKMCVCFSANLSNQMTTQK